IELHLTGHMEKFAWSFDGIKFSDAEPLRLTYGERLRIVLVNDTMMTHPIHLHGMSFKVLASNRHKVIPYFTDTYLLGKNERARVALVADNPGVWMFHCHVIDHMETGLMAAIEVA
ncbi:multicopper oxidase domain-containing protein, partial [Escherichia coli]|uniref:multicopper oxidase domain-containing protein n=1 Tax=Escherichia coli TaxID=562 RepID=UPI00403E6E25